MHKCLAFVFEHAGGDGCFGMEDARSVGPVTAFGVGCTIHDTVYLRPADGTGAHRTGFDGDIEGRIGDVFAADGLCGRRDSLHLRVGGDITQGLGEVVPTTDDLILRDDDIYLFLLLLDYNYSQTQLVYHILFRVIQVVLLLDLTFIRTLLI